MAVRVEPEEGVVLVAPRDTEIPRLDQVVAQKASWIFRKLRHVSEMETAIDARRFLSGESYSLLGRGYRLKVIKSVDSAHATIEEGHILVSVPKDMHEQERSKLVREELESWYGEQAKAFLQKRVSYWAKKTGLSPTSIMIRAQKKRWASCDGENNLRLNWRIIQAPQSLIDYVIVHELCHLTHKDHTQAFWSLLGTHMPDYETRKEELRVLGPRLIW